MPFAQSVTLALRKWKWKGRSHDPEELSSRITPNWRRTGSETDPGGVRLTFVTWRPSALLEALVYSFNTIFTCLVPIVAIVILANLHTKAQLLGTISAFTAIFAFVLTVFTKARRVEIFTATAT
jgi:hypothetical protein